MRHTTKSAGVFKAYVVMIIAGFMAKSGMEYSSSHAVTRQLAVSARAPRAVATAAARPAATPVASNATSTVTATATATASASSSVSPVQASAKKTSATAEPLVGRYGGNLRLLRDCYSAPVLAGESNHYIDLWSRDALPAFARGNGLTNNHALFVDSHASSGFSWNGRGYGFFPSSQLLGPQAEVPVYSAADLAALLGAEEARSIHNIVLAGCNQEGRFQSAELRKYFVNATNITYMTPGQLAYKSMFHQAITNSSDRIHPLYGKPHTLPDGRVESEILAKQTGDARPLGVYLADLYLPAARKPFRTVQAGRELLDPACLQN